MKSVTANLFTVMGTIKNKLTTTRIKSVKKKNNNNEKFRPLWRQAREMQIIKDT